MTIRKQPNGKWLCECYPYGRNGKRVRKQFATKGEAIAFESFIMDEVNKKPWLGEKEDRRRLSEVIELWCKYPCKTAHSLLEIFRHTDYVP